MDRRPDPGAQRAFLVFAAAVGVFQNVPAVLPEGDLFDVATPFAVVGASALVLLRLGARGFPAVLAGVAAIAYTSGQGIHLAANSVADEMPIGDVAAVAEFWDETFGHIWWHLGWLGLLAAFCLAERNTPAAPRDRNTVCAAAVLLGFTLFTNTVEGGTWWLGLGAACVLAAVAWRRRGRLGPLVSACTLAFALDALFIGIWAAWQGGLPQFSELGLV